MKISLTKLVSAHIDEARALNMSWEQYINYLWFKDKIEGEIEISLRNTEVWQSEVV